MGYLGAVAIVAGATALSALLRGHVDSSDLTMLYLLGVVICATAFGRGPAIAAAVLSVGTFDFLFVPPHFTFQVSDARYFVTFAVMLVVAVVTGTLTARLRAQREEARLREKRVTSLYQLSHDLVLRTGPADVLDATVARLNELAGTTAAVLIPGGDGRGVLVAGDAQVLADASERGAAESVLLHGRPIGLPPADHDPSRPAQVFHLPLIAGTKINAVLSLAGPRTGSQHDPERMALIRAFSSLTALALERCRLAEDTRRAQLQIETERARNALLSSVSHDLRTPLAAITGAASTLRDATGSITNGTRQELAETIGEEALRLSRLIGNLLDMTRLESGALRVKKEWHSLEEVVGAALARLGPDLAAREIVVALLPGLPLIPMDDVLFEQVVRNLIENALKYSPPNQPIEIRAALASEALRFEVSDRGDGLAPGEESLVFQKFYRGARASARPGSGLGLAICRGIVEAHGGTITAMRRDGGGTRFEIILPLEGVPPVIEGDEEGESGESGESFTREDTPVPAQHE